MKAFFLSSLFTYLFAVYVSSVQEEDVLPKEAKQEGAVTKDTYMQYMKAMHSGFAALFIICLFILTQV